MKKMISLSMAVLAHAFYAQITITKDAAFGNNGTVSLEPAGSQSHFLIIPEISPIFLGNKIFVANPSEDPTDPNAAPTKFTRLNSNGTPDTTFGNNGYILVPDFEMPYFYANNDFFYLNGVSSKKYLSNGQQDTSFASSGAMQNNTDWYYKIVLQDGKILLRGNNTFGRYLPDGNPDPAYGTNGIKNISGSIAGDPNSSSFEFFFTKDNAVYEFTSPGPGQSTIRKIDVNTGALDLSYGQSGYAQMRTSAVPSGAGSSIWGSAITPQADGTFINQLSDNNNIYLTRTTSQGNIDPTFGSNGTITASKSFSYNGNTYSSLSGEKPLVYNNMILIPAAYNDAQGNSSWIMRAFSLNGNSMTINSDSSFPLPGISYTNSQGVLFAKDNYLYALHGTDITRYVIQNAATLSLSENTGKQDDVISFNNPFTEELVLHSKEKIRTVEIKDMSGRTVIKGNSEKIDTSMLVKGNYLITITTESGKTIARKGIKS